MVDGEKDVLLLIADISGYTRFMLHNAATLRHAQTVITSLMDAVIKEAKAPLVIAKLEGDAVFLQAVMGAGWARDRVRIREALGRFYQAFSRRAADLKSTDTCGCAACAYVDRLSIKFVVHAGRALFYKIAGLQELAGPDVIVVHRLLKNSVTAEAYVLLTEAAWQALGYDEDEPSFVRATEAYDDVGTLAVRVRTDMEASQPEHGEPVGRSGHWGRIRGMDLRMAAMWQAGRRTFHHLGGPEQ